MHTASMAGPLFVLGELCTGFQLVPGKPAPSKLGSEDAVADDEAGFAVEVASGDREVIDAFEVAGADAEAEVDRAPAARTEGQKVWANCWISKQASQ